MIGMIGIPQFIIDERVIWYALSYNPNAIHILEQNLDKVDWDWLSENPNAIPILEKHLDKVNWYNLSENPNAIHLFSKLDINKMKKNNKAFAEELVSKVFHPTRLLRICETYNLELEELVELI